MSMRCLSRCTLTALFVCCLVSSPAPVWASGFRNPPDGAAALGYSGCKLTLVQDASAIVHNPASLVQLKSPEVMASVTLVVPEAEFTSALGARDKTETDVQWLPSLFATWPVGAGPHAAGVALSVPYGQSTEWDKNGLFRYTAPYLVKLMTLDVSPTLALKLNDRLSVGVAGDIVASDFKLRQVYSWSMVAGVPVLPDGEIKFDADGMGLGAHAGINWQATDRASVALTYRSPFDVDYEGDFSITQIPLGFFSPGPSSDFETTIKFPSVIAAGCGFRVTDTLRVGADIEWIEFSRYDRVTFDVGAHALLLGQTTVQQNWKDAWTVGVGADWKLSDWWTARAGYTFIESPIPDSTLAPTLPDADRSVASVGLGYNAGCHHLDVGYAYSFFDERHITQNQNPNYLGSYELETHLLGISYRYRF